MKRLLRKWLPDEVLNGTRHWRYRARLGRVALRARSKQPRLAPSFLIVGAMKAGTTSLFEYLCTHPNVASPIVKEIHYFNFNWSRPMRWYLAHFPKRASVSADTVTGEASPGYIVHPRVPERVRERLPEARIIVLYRDPVARTLSHYFHARRVGHEQRPIEQALFAEESYARFGLSPEEERPWYDAMNGGPRSRARASALIARSPMHLAYISQSRYADHLPAWFDTFGRDRVLVLRSEDMFRDPAGQLRGVVQFLGLEADANQPDFAPHNVGKYPSSVPAEIIARLKAEFVEPNRRLSELTGREFGWDEATSAPQGVSPSVTGQAT